MRALTIEPPEHRRAYVTADGGGGFPLAAVSVYDGPGDKYRAWIDVRGARELRDWLSGWLRERGAE